MCLAIPGKVIELLDEGHTALTDISGVQRKVNVDLLDETVSAGEWVLIHVGFAMSKLSEDLALEQLELLELMGETEAALEELGQVAETSPLLATDTTCASNTCPTCKDEAIAVRVLNVSEDSALVEDETGKRSEVATDYISALLPGDQLLIHAGVALSRLEDNA